MFSLNLLMGFRAPSPSVCELKPNGGRVTRARSLSIDTDILATDLVRSFTCTPLVAESLIEVNRIMKPIRCLMVVAELSDTV